MSLNCLCFVARDWYTNFLLPKLEEQGVYCFTHFWAEDFPGWVNNYNEYVLPIDQATEPDFVLVDNKFYVNRAGMFGHDYMRAYIRRKSRSHGIPVVAIDHGDQILSKYTAGDVDCFDLVLKGHGLPRDRELMNWEIGARWGLNRCKKIRRVRHEEFRYTPAQLDKFRSSFDVGVAYCDRSPCRLQSTFEPIDVFFVAVFNSLNRLQALKLSKEHFCTVGHLVEPTLAAPRGTRAPYYALIGFEEGKEDPHTERPGYQRSVRQARRRFYDENRDLFGPRTPRWRFRFLASLSKIMPAMSGYGELGPRHYQVLAFGKTLVCEDLSYIESIYPFQDEENCVFVSDHLENLVDRVSWLLENRAARRHIARRGFEQLRETYQDGDRIFKRYFLDYLGLVPKRTVGDRHLEGEATAHPGSV